LTRNGVGWRLMWYKAGIITDRCHIVQLRNERQILLCENIDGGQGFFRRVLYVEDFLRPNNMDLGEGGSFFRVPDSTWSCGIAPGEPDRPDPVIKGGITAVEFHDLNGDGLEDMTAIAYIGKMTLSKDQILACEGSRDRSNLPQIRITTYRIDFLFDGKTYHPAPRSRAAAKLFSEP
jgi:hypothetical protein